MRECFEKQDIGMLQKVVSEMDQKEAAYHIDRQVFLTVITLTKVS